MLLQLKTIAQPQDLKFKNYELNGLESRINIVRDSSGYIWLGGRGLGRFDGSKFKNYQKNESLPNSLRNDFTYNLIVDKNGTLWLGAGGLCYYNRALDGFTYVDKYPAKKFTYAEALLYDGKETIWFCCDLGLCSLNINTKKITETSLKDYSYASRAIINSGKVWLCTWHGSLFIYDPAKDTYEKFLISDKSKTASIAFIFNDKQNKVWVAKTTGIIKINPEKLTDKYGKLNFETIRDLQNVSLSLPGVSMLYFPAYTGDSILWMATDSHGLMAFNIHTQKIAATYLPDKSDPYSISTSTPASLYVDKDNHLWISHSNGLSLLNIYNQNFKSRTITELSNEPYGYIVCLEQDKAAKDIVWMGTSQGIIKYNWAQKKTLNWIKKFDQQGDNSVNTISDDENGSLWIGSVNSLYQYSKQTNTFTKHLLLPTGIKFGYQTDIYKILSLHDTILIATSIGLFEYFAKQQKYKILYTETDKGEFYNSCFFFSMKQDKDGILWCVGAKGLLKVDLKNNKHTLYIFNDQTDFFHFNRFTGIDFDSNNIIIAASAGVVLFNKSTRQFSKLTSAEDAALNNSWNVKVDTQHNLWITTWYGLVFFNSKKKIHQTFTADDGLPRNFSPMTVDMINNTIVFKARNKFAYIDPYSVEKNSSIPQPVITGFSIFGKPVLFDPESAAKTNYNLSYKQNFISFDFNAFEFNYPDKIQFAYRLKGFDKGWILSGNRKNATYTNLPNGNYTFEMKAANSEGLWSKPAVFMIYIKAAFWQTLWFGCLIAFMVALIVYFIVRSRIKKIRQEEATKREHQRELLELELQTMRSQMNPHFIFNSLNSIQKYIWENRQEDTAEYLNKFSRLMRMTLDNSMQKWITLEQELNALTLYIELEHRRSNNKFNYQIQVNECLDVTTILVPPLILQPYVENAIWHGLLPKDGRGDLHIKVMPGSKEDIACIIEDNGIGCNANPNGTAKNESKRTSYGMQLTRQRIMMSESNGQHGDVAVEDLKQDNNTASGTRVTIHLPLNSFIKI